jgi:hypothetical protein
MTASVDSGLPEISPSRENCSQLAQMELLVGKSALTVAENQAD